MLNTTIETSKEKEEGEEEKDKTSEVIEAAGYYVAEEKKMKSRKRALEDSEAGSAEPREDPSHKKVKTVGSHAPDKDEKNESSTVEEKNVSVEYVSREENEDGEEEEKGEEEEEEEEEKEEADDTAVRHTSGLVVGEEEKHAEEDKEKDVSSPAPSPSSGTSNVQQNVAYTEVLPKAVRIRKKEDMNTPKDERRTTTVESGGKGPKHFNRGRWTKQEHNAFLKGLAMYGKRWKMIGDMIVTRSAVQIRSHAQKHFDKIERAQHGHLRKSAAAILESQQQLMNQQHMAMMSSGYPMGHPMMYSVPHGYFMNPYVASPHMSYHPSMGAYVGNPSALHQATEQMSAALSAAESGGMGPMPPPVSSYDYPSTTTGTLPPTTHVAAPPSYNYPTTTNGLPSSSRVAAPPPSATMPSSMLPHYSSIPSMEDLSGAPFYYGVTDDGTGDRDDPRQKTYSSYMQNNTLTDPVAPLPMSPVMGYYPTSSQQNTNGASPPGMLSMYSAPRPPMTSAAPPVMPDYNGLASERQYDHFPVSHHQMYGGNLSGNGIPRNYKA